MKSEYHILNLGAGVQSTTLYLMFMRGEIKPQIDCAIFADTQEEPGAVYRHLEWLQSLKGPEILVRTAGKLGDDLARGVNSTGQRFASIPAFTSGTRIEYDYDDDGEIIPGSGIPIEGIGRTRRQCSMEYKIAVLEKAIRREIVGLKPRQRMPKDVIVHQYMGISLDEAGRARRISYNMCNPHWIPHFPLIDRFFTRADCITYMADKVPHECPRSACVFCPYHSDAEWWRIRNEDPEGWQRAVYIDKQLRVPGNIIHRNHNQELFVHRSCKPLDEVAFDTRPKPRDLQLSMSFAAVCEGVCGV